MKSAIIFSQHPKVKRKKENILQVMLAKLYKNPHFFLKQSGKKRGFFFLLRETTYLI